MKKSVLFCIVTVILVPSALADYTLTSADRAAIQAVIEKIQTKPIRTQEVVIKALKDAQNKTNFTEKKQAIFAAVESGLRHKNSSGDYLATSLERKEVIQSVFAQNIEKETMSATLRVTGDLSSSVEPKKVVFDSTFSADVDLQETKNPKVRVRFDGDFEADVDKISGKGEMRVVDRMGYMIIEKILFIPDENSIASFIDPYINAWVKFPLEESFLGDMQDTTFTQSQTHITTQKILSKNNVIPQLLYKGQTKGVSIYSGNIDTNAFMTAMSEVFAAQGEILSESDIQDMKDTLQGVKIQTQFSLDTKKTISDITFIAQISSKILEDDSMINGTVTIHLMSSPFTGTILEPKDAQNIDEFIQQ